jgi:chemotaxis protein CheC
MPNELQLDALREVANVGCGHAATALSRLVGGRRVHVELPRVWVRPAAEVNDLLGGPDARLVVTSFVMEGEVTGRLLLALAEPDGLRLSEALVNLPSVSPLSEHHHSALAEAANIVASACLSAIGGLTGQRLVPSVPTLFHGRAGDLTAQLWKADAARTMLVLDARFVAQLSPLLPGTLLVVPDAPGLKALLARLGV